MPEATATFEVRREGLAAIVDIRGDVTAGSEVVLMSAYEETGDARAIILNFTDLAYMNSGGIGLLARARATGLEVRAYGLTPHYQEIFEITRLADFLAINPDEDSAVRGAEGSRDA